MQGCAGIGIVNAMEIVHAFPGQEGLKKFRAWVEAPDAGLAAAAARAAGAGEGGVAGGGCKGGGEQCVGCVYKMGGGWYDSCTLAGAYAGFCFTGKSL